MKTAIQKLDRLIGGVTATMATCGTSKNKEDLMESLSATAAEIQDSISYLQAEHKRKFIQVRKALNAVRNVMLGMNDGLASSEMTLREFRLANKTLASKFLPNVRAGLIAEVEEIEAANAKVDEDIRVCPVSEGTKRRIKLRISDSGDLQSARTVIAKSVDHVGVSVSGNDAVSVLKAFEQKAWSAMPLTLNPGTTYTFARLPIVPLLPKLSAPKYEELKRLGLHFVFIEGFTVLQEQLLLNVSKSRCAKAGETPLAWAYSVVELKSEHGSTKYEMVSDTPIANKRNPDLLMFWILPRHQMSVLTKLMASTKSGSLIKWGLPIPSGRASSEKARLEEAQKREHKPKRSEEDFLKKKAELEAKKAAERKKDAQHRQNLEARKAAAAKLHKEKLDALVRQNLEHRGRLTKNPKLKR